MSIVATLAALKALAATTLTGVGVYDRPQKSAGLGVGPALILSAYDYHEDQVATWMREQDEGKPNVYAFAYLERPSSQQTSLTEQDIVTRVYTNMELFFALFRVQANQGLPDVHGNDQVSFAGRSVSARFYVEGPVLAYGGATWLGCVGKITVEELYTEDT